MALSYRNSEQYRTPLYSYRGRQLYAHIKKIRASIYDELHVDSPVYDNRAVDTEIFDEYRGILIS